MSDTFTRPLRVYERYEKNKLEVLLKTITVENVYSLN